MVRPSPMNDNCIYIWDCIVSNWPGQCVLSWSVLSIDWPVESCLTGLWNKSTTWQRRTASPTWDRSVRGSGTCTSKTWFTLTSRSVPKQSFPCILLYVHLHLNLLVQLFQWLIKITVWLKHFDTDVFSLRMWCVSPRRAKTSRSLTLVWPRDWRRARMSRSCLVLRSSVPLKSSILSQSPLLQTCGPWELWPMCCKFFSPLNTNLLYKLWCS